MAILRDLIKTHGGDGSGNFGHAGRPGQVGGSAPSGEGSRGRTDKPVVFQSLDIWGIPMDEDVQQGTRMKWKRRSVEAVAAKLDGKGKELKPLIEALSDMDLVAIPLRKPNLEDPKVVKTVVNSFIASWANSACDNSPTALAIQKATADEFGLPLPDRVLGKLKGPLQGSTLNTIARDALLKDKPQAGFRLLVRAQYEATQDFLKEKGVESITLARGMAIKKEVARGMSVSGGTVEVESNPLSSWTLDKGVALTFSRMGDGEVDAPRILVSTFDRQDIMAIPGAGMGCLPEAEFVVRGGRHVAQSYDYEHLKGATEVLPWIPPEEPKGNARGWGLPVIDIDAINEDWPKRTNDRIPRWPWPKRGRKGVPKVHGGPGSGNFGHSGRPGEVGGSASSPGSSERGSSTYDKGGWGSRGRANIDRLNRATSKDHIMVDGISVDLDKAKSMVARNPNHLVAIRPAEKKPQPDTSADYSKHLHPDRLELMQREVEQKMQNEIEEFERSSRWKDTSYFRELRSMKQTQRAVANQNKKDLKQYRFIHTLLVEDKNPRRAKVVFDNLDTAARDDLLMMIPKGPARAALAKDLGTELSRAGRR